MPDCDDLRSRSGVLSIDKTPDGVAIKFSEKARISPEKLAALLAARVGSIFSPSGVLRLILNEDEQDGILEFALGLLLEVRVSD